jgi:arylsulfatase
MAAGIPQPTEVNGVKQKPIEGVSMVYSFDNETAGEARKVQYFELLGNRGIYVDGWLASARHGRLPWIAGIGSSTSFEDDKWELYDLRGDFTQYDDVAAKNPQKLKELQDVFWIEAEKYQVLPLDDRLSERMNPALRPSLIAGRTVFDYYPGSRIPDSSAAPTQNRSHTITAYLEVPNGGADGVLVAVGGTVGGFSLYVKDGQPVYEYNLGSLQRSTIKGAEPLKPGPNVVRMEFRYDGGGLGKGATVSLLVNDRKVGEGRINATNWIGKYSADETFDIGEDSGSPVSDDYAAPSRFSGTIKKVVIDVEPANLTAADLERQQVAERAAGLTLQ